MKTGSNMHSPDTISVTMDANYGLWTTCYKENDEEESCINSFLIEEPLSNCKSMSKIRHIGIEVSEMTSIDRDYCNNFFNHSYLVEN